jgi:divalent metal cation (Fe/Co/Zn/Cd) transporter
MNTREAIVARGLRLEYFSLGWNVLEALIALISGFVAGSIALIGFGLDSVVEVSSAAVMLWRLRADRHAQNRERTEKTALRAVGICFLVLAAYVSFEGIHTLLRHEAPLRSLPGILLAVASLIVMPVLAGAKRKVASGIKSGAMQADSRQTDICAYLSTILLGGLVFNAVFGWWWADPIAGLVMVPLIANEGIEAVRGRTCCDNAAQICGEIH